MKRPNRKPGEPDVSFKERMAALRNLPSFFKLVWQTSPGMALSNAILRAAQSATPLALLYVGKLIIDEVVRMTKVQGDLSYQYLWELVAVEFGIVMITGILGRLIGLLDGLLGEKVANHTSVRIMQHAATLDLDQFEDSAFYDKLERARQQTVGRTILLSQVLSQVQDVTTMIFLAAGLITFSPWLILLLFVSVLPAFFSETYFNDKFYALAWGQTSDRRELDYIRFLGASDESVKEVKIFNLSSYLVNRFKGLSDKFYNDKKDLSIKYQSWAVVFAIVGSAGYYGAYVFIILQTVKGQLSIGDLAFLGGSFRQLRGLLEGVLIRFTSITQGAIYLRDLFEFFEIQPRITQRANARPFPKPILEGFTFEDVGFKYLNSDRWANRHLNFTLHAGEKLALVGENGAGKTTLVKLLARLYDPVEGRILLDGHDLKEYDLQELRMQVGVIFQDFQRYQMTVSQNIAIGNIRELGNQDLIENAAQKSMADSLMERLPGGYDQMLGRRFNNGIELSGGEWQKIALARAYMKNAQLLILDEPTAALDARAEYEVFLRFADLTKGKSAVLISHRFSTVRMADRILVLEKGELIEIGSHDELLLKNGRYAELFHLQAKGYR
ncbi:ATP-binding cassette domain-containing protein [Chitinophaga sp. SYP-B3965]|uniref:ABC transporter ATP-binding protein n=1 Tax=Chitinophaga sp. SYP-B3965 TaxID=2663120 RepID=UPI001299A2BF|nr:ABC transporter ATP-binding protein [Chitinophaga sp. SYP-B3965]MRG44789.1 ATP-binding cassette domain-containing protein [Chitinophaga sp. SYP-B3965]